MLQHGFAPNQMIMLPAAGEGALAVWSALSRLGALGALRRQRLRLRPAWLGRAPLSPSRLD